MKYKVIFSDYDDTITSSKRIVSSKTKEMINKYIELGGIFVISTGRSYKSISAQLPSLFFDGYNGYVITLQGGRIYFGGKLIYNKTLDKGRLIEYIEEVKSRGLNCQVYCGSEMYSSLYDSNSKIYEDLTGTKVHLVEDLACFVQKSEYEFNKLLTFVNPSVSEQIENEIREKFPEFKLVLSRPQYLEAIPMDSGKDRAIKFVASQLNVNLNDVICVGDGENDADMIKIGGLGVAVGNAHKTAKAAAKIIVPSNDDDGLAYLLEKVINGENLCY